MKSTWASIYSVEISVLKSFKNAHDSVSGTTVSFPGMRVKSCNWSPNINLWMCAAALVSDFLKRFVVVFNFNVMSIYKSIESFATKLNA